MNDIKTLQDALDLERIRNDKLRSIIKMQNAEIKKRDDIIQSVKDYISAMNVKVHG